MDYSSLNEAMWQEQKNGAWITGTLAEAVAKVCFGGTVMLLSDVSLTESIFVSRDDVIEIRSYYGDRPCKIKNMVQDQDDGKSRGRIFTVMAGELRLRNLVLDGGRSEGVTAYHPLICVTGKNAALRLLEGAVVQNAENGASGLGGGVSLRRGRMFMHDGSAITHCKAKNGGGVMVNSAVTYEQAAFDMAGGRIADCEADNGGGVFVGSGLFQMHGGEITSCLASKDDTGDMRTGGGGICIAGGLAQAKTAAARITNGRILGNRAASNGGGILVQGRYALLQLESGILEGNTANCGGGVSVVWGNLKLYGGMVVDNRADLYGGGILGTPNSLIELQRNPKVFGNTAGDTTDRFDNLYLDGAEDDFAAWATSPVRLTGALTEGVRLGMSRWVRPDKEGHPYREMIVPGGGYRIQESDFKRISIGRENGGKGLYTDNGEKYVLLPCDGKIVMVPKVDIMSKPIMKNVGQSEYTI